MKNGRKIALTVAAVVSVPLAAQAGEQSILTPRGEEAGQVALLFWAMTGLSAAVLVGVMATAWVALTGGSVRRLLAQDRFVLGAGLFFPATVLTVLLVWGLSIMADREIVGEPALRVSVTGELWWWRVVYHLSDGTSIEAANEIRIPVGEPVEFRLRTADVIHSFWVPNLAGKLDMIPGRTNRLTLRATEAGISRGQCAEYCGGAHAFMAFHVVALPPADFQAWLRTERAPVHGTDDEGARLFLRSGCGACHRVRGLAGAEGRSGPDLTHVGGRLSLAAATLPNDAPAFARWLRDNQHIKPQNRMPPYGILTDAELETLAGYLDSLE